MDSVESNVRHAVQGRALRRIHPVPDSWTAGVLR
jgi:hypothetical protein